MNSKESEKNNSMAQNMSLEQI
jgi:hypothetical protein